MKVKKLLYVRMLIHLRRLRYLVDYSKYLRFKCFKNYNLIINRNKKIDFCLKSYTDFFIVYYIGLLFYTSSSMSSYLVLLIEDKRCALKRGDHL